MEYEVTSGLDEQSKAVVINTKVRITATDGQEIDRELLETLIKVSAEATIREYETLRPFAEAKTLRKQGR